MRTASSEHLCSEEVEVSREHVAANQERIALSFSSQVDTGTTLLECFGKALSGLMIASGLIDILLGALLVYYGTVHSEASCTFAFASWAVICGAVSICVGATGVSAGILIIYVPVAACIVNVISAALSACIFGILVWGSVLAFSHDRWTNVMISPPAAGPPCSIALYRPVASIVIASWIVFGTYEYCVFVALVSLYRRFPFCVFLATLTPLRLIATCLVSYVGTVELASTIEQWKRGAPKGKRGL